MCWSGFLVEKYRPQVYYIHKVINVRLEKHIMIRDNNFYNLKNIYKLIKVVK